MDKDNVKKALEDYAQEGIAQMEKKHGKLRTFIILAVLAVILFLIGSTSLRVWGGIVASGIREAKNNFQNTKALYEEQTEAEVYQLIYDEILHHYQPKNEVFITVESIKETANLQVLMARERVVITQTPEERESNENLNYWIIYDGTATYTVNMQICEFVTDNDRHFVLARLPRPDTKIAIVDEKILLATNKKSNDGSLEKGSALSRKARNTANAKLEELFLNDAELTRKAEEAAKKQVEFLIRALNPGIDDLTVKVLFFDE